MTALSGSRAFVTGATGFIGSHLLRRLFHEGVEVSILARPGASFARIGDLLPKIQILEGDLCDPNSLGKALRLARPERVFHLGAYTHVARDLRHTEKAMAINLQGTVNLLQALDGVDLDCFVASGTCEEYGDAEPPLHEELPPKPVSPYSVSKAAATLWCLMVHRTTKLPVVILRPFLCYGPGQGPNRLISSAIITALEGRDFPMTEGEQTREFTHVADIVEGYIRAALVPAAVGQVINLGSGVEYRIRDFVEKIYEMTGSTGRPLVGAVPYRPAEIWRIVASTEKARRILGWDCKIGLEEGLRETIESYRASVAAHAVDAGTEQ